MKAKSRREPLPIEGAPEPKLPVLWKATLQIMGGGGQQFFMFRHGNEVTAASQEAERLLQGSHAPAASASVITGVERIGRLWN